MHASWIENWDGISELNSHVTNAGLTVEFRNFNVSSKNLLIVENDCKNIAEFSNYEDCNRKPEISSYAKKENNLRVNSYFLLRYQWRCHPSAGLRTFNLSSADDLRVPNLELLECWFCTIAQVGLNSLVDFGNLCIRRILHNKWRNVHHWVTIFYQGDSQSDGRISLA